VFGHTAKRPSRDAAPDTTASLEQDLVNDRNGATIRRDLSFEFFDFNQVNEYDCFM
jgi:hypothetical protein